MIRLHLLCKSTSPTNTVSHCTRKTTSPKTVHPLGKPVITGTRISVELLLELLESGWTHRQIFESYPHRTYRSHKLRFKAAFS